MSAPDYTLAICTHNHADELALTLREVGRLAAPSGRWELLVVDNASRDATPRILAGSDWHVAGIANRVVHEPALGVANARNRAIREARGEYVLFLDDDESPAPDWLQAMERVILAHRPDAVGGPYRVRFEGVERPSWLGDDLLGFLGELDHGAQPRRLTDPSTQIYTGNSAFRRATLFEQGLFDPHLGRRGADRAGGEDTEMYRRLLARGCDLRWAPDAVIYHRVRADKLSRGYFTDLHFNQGRLEGRRARGDKGAVPPLWVAAHLARAAWRALGLRLARGADRSLRAEMNVAYFAGFARGWMAGGSAPVAGEGSERDSTPGSAG